MHYRTFEATLFRIVPLILLGVILFYGTSLRVDQLSIHQLTYDEAILGNVARNWLETGNPSRNFLGRTPFYDHPPLWWLSMSLSITLFGADIGGLRLHSIFIGLFIILLVYRITREYLKRTVEIKDCHFGALFAAVLIAINPVFIHFSQTNQIESGLHLWGLLALLFYLQSGPSGKTISAHQRMLLFGSGIFCSLAIGVKYLAVFYVFLIASQMLLDGKKSDHYGKTLWWGGGFLFGLSGLILLIPGLYGLQNSPAFFKHSIMLPFLHVLSSESNQAPWRVLEWKPFLDKVYAWYHPIPLLTMVTLVVLIVGLLFQVIKKGRKCEQKAGLSVSPVLTPLPASIVGIGWLVFLALYSGASRSIPYASLAIPLFAIFIGYNIQLLAEGFRKFYQSPMIKRSGPAFLRYFPRTISYFRAYGPGVALVLTIWFIHASFLFGNAMYKKERDRNLAYTDPSIVVGSFLANRFPGERFFVSSTHGPQLSFISGLQYDLTYTVIDLGEFKKRVRPTKVYIQFGTLKRASGTEEIEAYLDKHFQKGEITKDICYYTRKETSGKSCTESLAPDVNINQVFSGNVMSPEQK